MAGRRIAKLRHAMNLSLLRLEPGFETHVDKDIAGKDRPLPAHTGKKKINRGIHQAPASTSAGRKEIACRGHTWAQTSQPVHWLASISALGRWVFSSNSSLVKMAGQPMRKQRVQPLHWSAQTSRGTQRLRTSGSNTQGSSTISTDGSSIFRYALSAFSMA